MISGALVEKQSLSGMPFGYRDSGNFIASIGGSDELSWQEVAVGISIFVLGLAAYVGVISFIRSGRRLYLLFHILDLAASPLTGPRTVSGWGDIFSGASLIVAGTILAFLYFTPLKEHFEKKKTDASGTPVSGTLEGGIGDAR